MESSVYRSRECKQKESWNPLFKNIINAKRFGDFKFFSSHFALAMLTHTNVRLTVLLHFYKCAGSNNFNF